MICTGIPVQEGDMTYLYWKEVYAWVICTGIPVQEGDMAYLYWKEV